MKKVIIIFILLSFALPLFSCSGEKTPKIGTPGAVPSAAASSAVVPGSSPEAGGETPPDAAEKDALAVAELYRDIFMSVYEKNSAGIYLTDSETESILKRLGDNGFAAVDGAGLFPMQNADIAEDFLTKWKDGSDARLTVCEIYSDGGFLLHGIVYENGLAFVMMARVAWLDRGPHQLSGDTPTVTFKANYDITSLEMTPDGYLQYDYYMPDNPEGTNHDGHVDTTVRLRIR